MKRFVLFSVLLSIQCLALFAQTTVTVQGRQILVNDSVYTIRGVCYSPVAIGDDRFDPMDFSQIDLDIQLMTQASINTIRTYVPIMDPAVLDKFSHPSE